MIKVGAFEAKTQFSALLEKSGQGKRFSSPATASL